MFDVTHSLLIILVVALMTALTRFLPFLIFRHHTPRAILYLGEVLPCAVMGMLVIYCLKGVSLFSGSHGLPEGLSILLVAILHKWKHSTFLSLVAGTVCYMLLIQFVF